jgi:hypothetical protein
MRQCKFRVHIDTLAENGLRLRILDRGKLVKRPQTALI